MIKRLFVIVLFATFSSSPLLAWLCRDSCDSGHHSAVTEDCHRPEAALLEVDGGHDCGEHAVPMVFVTKRVQIESRSPESLLPVFSVPAHLMPSSRESADSVPPDIRPPDDTFRAPLRI